jgi:IclR family acetate operon transcriptional repressor
MADLARATAVLNALAEGSGPMSLNALVRVTGLPRSAVHRVVQALVEQHYVISSSERPGYLLGPGILKFGMTGHLRLVAAHRSRLARLAREVRECTTLAVFAGREAVMVDEVGAPSRLSSAPTKLGRSVALHASATGGALLAQFPDEQVRDLLPTDLRRFTSRTLVEHSAVMARLEEVRRSGIAMNMEEHEVGLAAVATGLAESTDTMIAMAVVLPSQRLPSKVDIIVAALKRINPAVDIQMAERQLRRSARPPERPARSAFDQQHINDGRRTVTFARA